MQELIIPIKLAFKNLRTNLGRTFLSLLGIVIGIMSVILVLAFGGGVKQFLVDQVSSFGTDIISVEIKVPKVSKTSSQNAGGMVGGTVITTLTLDDAKKISKVSNIGDWYAIIMGQQVISHGNKDKAAYVMGVTDGVTRADEKTEIEEGAMFTEDDDNGLRQVAVLGSEAKNYFFEGQEAVGQEIKIKGQNYRVIGVLKSRGVTGFFNFDDIVYVPIQTLQKKVMGIDHIQSSVFKIRDMGRLDATIAEITDLMRDRHDIRNPDDDDFAVNSIVEIMEILDKVFFAINALLLALTSISLIVGGVGIMNVMYVAVTERTFEIGLKKAVGARKGQIMAQFLTEAIFLTVFGGIIGIALGFTITKLGAFMALRLGYDLVFPVTWEALSIGFGFCALTGLAFGYYPARKASLLTPMEALRKE